MDSKEIKEQLHEIEVIKKNRELSAKIKDITTAMLTTTSASGHPHSRPMYANPLKDDGIFWFFTNKESRKITEIIAHPEVNLTFTVPADNLYVSVNGMATISEDRMKIEELWTETLRGWFPAGKNDPNIALIRIEPSEAEYWDAPDSIFSQIISVVKATLAGNPYRVGENKKVDLHG